MKQVKIHDGLTIKNRYHVSLKKHTTNEILIEDKVVNDFAEKYNAQINKLMDRFPGAPKMDQITRWVGCIDVLYKEIKKIRIDNDMNSDDKKRKISRRLDIIADHQFSIRQAVDYLQYQADRYDAIRLKYIQRMK